MNKVTIIFFIIEMIFIIIFSAVFTHIGKGDFLISYLFFAPLFSFLTIIGTIIVGAVLKLKSEKTEKFLLFNAIFFGIAILTLITLIIYPFINNPI